MFFQGSIQDGISAAVGQQKLLLCFVTDHNVESQTWENEFLSDESVTDLIATKAITLRLEAGSDEAGYLAQIFPLPKTPTVVIMKHGELKEYIAAGTTKSEFLRRVSHVFSGSTSTPAPAAAPSASVATESTSDPSAAAASPSSPAGGLESDGSENVRRIVAERTARAQREAAERRAREDEATATAATATTAAKGKGKATDDASASSESAALATKTKAQTEAAELIRKKKAQESDERRRILKRIQDDKEARRAQASERNRKRLEVGAAERAAAQAQASTQQDTQAQMSAAARRVGGSATSSSSSTGALVAIQVRLSDGSTLRNKFEAAQTLHHVRAWVDRERADGHGPYSLKQVLAPLPSRTIDTTDEHRSVRELGLAPSATLLLIPIQRFATAYDGQASSRPGFLAPLLALLAAVLAWFSSLFGLGGGGGDSTQQTDSQTRDKMPLSGQRVRAFENPNRPRHDQQLYNGNSLNFEPRPDEDDI